MGLNVTNAPPLPFQRPTEDLDGNTTSTDLGDVPAVVSFASPGVETGNGPRYTQSGRVFVPRGRDVQAGDRFGYQGYSYTIMAVVRGDRRHPISGRELGWMGFTFQGGQSKWT